jgi:excisionase family DNA binding protein
MPSPYGVQVFTPGQVSLRTGLPMKTILRAIHDGELGAIQANKRVIRVPEGDLARWLELLRARAQRLRLK